MYREFARFYDRVEGDGPAGFARWIAARVAHHGAPLDSLLELGCGTGTVLAALPASIAKTGVDRSPEMLQQAMAKGMDARLVEADLTELDLGETFDVVACVFDTINHLLTAESWERAFVVARRHLTVGGLFLFDLNTIGRLQRMASEPAWVQDFDGNTLVMKISAVDGRFDWDIRVFELDGAHYRLNREVISEFSLPLSDVRALLDRTGFEVVEMRQSADVDATEDSDRVFVVCRAVAV